MYKVSNAVRFKHGQDGAVGMDVRQGQMLSLNPVGSRIVELLETGTTESQIADQISCEFRVGRHVAEIDLQEFLETLRKHRLIEECEPAVAG
jgi:coenzyme PQQ synthesis protein D (PqqD)